VITKYFRVEFGGAIAFAADWHHMPPERAKKAGQSQLPFGCSGHSVPRLSGIAPAQQKGWDMRPADLIMLMLIFGIMYFLLIRPQQKKLKEHQAMLAALRRGDQIVTQGGIVGKVVKVKDEVNEVEVEIAQGVNVRVVKATITTVLNKTEPAKS
jgi:preprotein translocase subunit YajC